MPSQRRTPPNQPPAPILPAASSKYQNKDGSKFITVPKATTSSKLSETSPAMAQTTTKPNGQMPVPPANTNGAAQGVNRKKQKRREKEKAKLAAQQPPNTQTNGTHPSATSKRQMEDLEQRFHNHGLQESYVQNGQFDSPEGDPYDTDDADDGYSGSYGQNGSPTNGYVHPRSNRPSKTLKGKKKARKPPAEINNHPRHMHNGSSLHNGSSSHHHVSLPIPSLAPTNMPRGPGISKEKIWNTSSQEERERIKEFWLSLGEDERKSLVKVEKDAVLKKMKEQQKHSCSCTVCGRKRTAIEEELEVLYDAYYEELEQYANHQGDGGPPPMMPPPRRFGTLTGLQPPHRLPPAFNGQQPSRGRIVEQIGEDEEEDDEEEDEEDYEEEEGDEEDDYSEEEEPEELPRTHATDFFNFGNSLTVQGGILTVADDLLKNDGKKFIEMMEQLAERRMAREEDAREQYSNPGYGHPPTGSMHAHSHDHAPHPPPVEEEEYEDDEDDDEYESGEEEDDYDEDEEMDTMTEEQRMEEGRRMFQIFAARMFEQRVLTAYKEKVAKERQQKLLEELEEENRADDQKKAKKAKDAQKKKEKLAQKKQLLAEEKAKREADKAAEDAAARAAEQQKIDEQRLKAEEKRKKREAQKKAEEEERQRKESEKQKRLQEQKDRQAELDRKQREAKERERKEKEDLRLKEKEAKEIREKEAKERKEKQEREKREKDAKAKIEKEAKDKQARDDLATQKAIAQATHAATQAAKRPPPVPIPANLHPHNVSSPKVPYVTPAVPKAPTPIKVRTTSAQHESPVPTTPQAPTLSQNVSPVPSTPLQGSPSLIGLPGKNYNQPHLHHPQATSPMHSALKNPPGFQPSPFGNASPINYGHQPFPPGMQFGRPPHEGLHSFPHPIGGNQYRPMPIPNGLPMPFHPLHNGRGYPVQQPPPGFGQQQPPGILAALFNAAKENGTTHSRQHSASFDPAPAQPIARPAPIGRPASVVHGQHYNDKKPADVEDVDKHLGSSALLDDSDEPITPGGNARRASAAPGAFSRQPFPQAPYGLDGPFANPMVFGNNTWGQPNIFGGSQPGVGGMWPASNSFGSMGGNPPMRPIIPRAVAVRLSICNACISLKGSPDGYYDIDLIREYIERNSTDLHMPVHEKELLDICETEGNAVNGGGTFDIRLASNGHASVRYERDVEPAPRQHEIGSPIIGKIGMPRFTGPPPGF